jgi:DNA invertase Pin-like site-specific DNA recombinase
MTHPVTSTAATSVMDFCRGHAEKFRLLMSVGGGDIGSHRMMEPEDDQKIERLWKAGKTFTEIADKLGLTDCTPRNRLLKMGYTKEELKRK